MGIKLAYVILLIKRRLWRWERWNANGDVFGTPPHSVYAHFCHPSLFPSSSPPPRSARSTWPGTRRTSTSPWSPSPPPTSEEAQLTTGCVGTAPLVQRKWGTKERNNIAIIWINLFRKKWNVKLCPGFYIKFSQVELYASGKKQYSVDVFKRFVSLRNMEKK